MIAECLEKRLQVVAHPGCKIFKHVTPVEHASEVIPHKYRVFSTMASIALISIYKAAMGNRQTEFRFKKTF